MASISDQIVETLRKLADEMARRTDDDLERQRRLLEFESAALLRVPFDLLTRPATDDQDREG